MSDFKKISITFSILKLQKSDAYQNGVEFRHKPNGNDVKWPPPLFCLPPPLFPAVLLIAVHLTALHLTTLHLTALRMDKLKLDCYRH